MFNFKMNKNKKINRKKSGIQSFPAMIIVLMMLFGFLFMLTIFAKMAVINREEIRKEAEAGNELIRIYIYIDEENVISNTTTTYTTTSGTQTQTITTTTPILSKYEKTRITITNQWGKTSVIDYFVVEDWNGGIISKGDLNIILGAGEEREFKGNDILNTFKLNDPNYAEDFWFFKSKIRCITLHTILGNTFGSAYKPVRPITQTYYHYYETRSFLFVNYTAITTTTYYGNYLLRIESHGPFTISPRDDNPIWYKIYEYSADGSRSAIHNLMPDVINPNSDPYGRIYLDGDYVYPAGILLTISHGLPKSFPSSWQYKKVYVSNNYNNIGPYGKLTIFVNKLELWELDQFGNEIRKILETTSNSITFAIFGNYKLKRYFGYTSSDYNPPPTTTITTTGGSGGPIEIYSDSWVWEPVRDSKDELTDGTSQTIDDREHRSDYWVWISSTKVESGGEYIVPGSFSVKYKPDSGWGDKVEVTLSLQYQPYTPIGERKIRVRVSYRVYYVPWIPT